MSARSPVQSKPIFRQLVFFILAVLLPSVVLVSFGVVLLRQETELGERRLEELRTFAAREVADSLLQTLEKAYLAEYETGVRVTDTNPPLLVLGGIEDGQANFLHDVEPAKDHPISQTDFQDILRSNSQLETLGNHREAIRRYESSLEKESDPSRRAFLQLGVARALKKLGLPSESQKWDEMLLGTPSDVTDEYGLPIAYFAAERMLSRRSPDPLVSARLVMDLNSNHWLSSAGLLFLSDLVEMAGMDGDAERQLGLVQEYMAVAQTVTERMAMLQQAETTGPSWALLPNLPWLVRRPGLAPGALVLVRLEDIQSFLGPKALRVRRGPAEGRADRGLPIQFSGLVVETNSAALDQSGDSRPFLIAGLTMVLGLTLFGGYLLWRDVRRETRMGQLRTQFVSSVSHELRTPLTSIRLFAEALLEHGGEERQERERSLSIIANESERLTRMLNNVLTTSRIEQGTMSYQPEYGELSEAASRSAVAMEYAFQQASIELKVELDAVWTVHDPDAIEQALINLLSNALKYAPSGKRVTLTCFRNGSSAYLIVADSGPGISTIEQGRIFERFYRSEQVDDRRVTGAGLGLALVHHIVEGHGGDVSVKSEPGNGATFTISLPIISSPIKTL